MEMNKHVEALEQMFLRPCPSLTLQATELTAADLNNPGLFQPGVCQQA